MDKFKPYVFINLAIKNPSITSFGSTRNADLKAGEYLLSFQLIRPLFTFGTGICIGTISISLNLFKAQSITSSFSSGENVQVEYTSSPPFLKEAIADAISIFCLRDISFTLFSSQNP